MTQLTLGVTLNDLTTFTNYYVAENNEVVNYLQAFCQVQEPCEHYVYLWGEAGIGKSHLLQACCHQLGENKQAVAYLPLREYKQFDANEVCAGLENLALVCIDDIDCIVGNAVWQEALFHLFNRLQAAKVLLLIAGSKAPTNLEITLPDLQSRLASGVTFQLNKLNDANKVKALQMRAKLRGMNLADAVANYILTHHSRNMHDLTAILNKLDQASLQEQRLLTIPFVKQVLEYI